ncbi:MAG: hypothetical protein GF309_14790 [Candidatus Lokiarchaeota archaeon]|jgi:hypothetical protein|nr:hypothetical protein [Candidatus Lokiarchaeota archaeon]
MKDRERFLISRDLENVKAQVKKELDNVRELMASTEYRNSPVGWNAPFQLHRLRRSLRMKYLAAKILDSADEAHDLRELKWDPPSDAALP